MFRFGKMMTAVLFASLCTVPGYAQIVPYKLSGSGVANPATGQFYGPSIATHQGNLSFSAQVISLTPKLDGGGNLVGFDYEGVDTQTAADGSKIFLRGTGSATLIYRPDLGPWMFEAYWDGAWVIDGSWTLGPNAPNGTGRFANVGPGTGPIQLLMYQEPFDLMSNELRPFIYVKQGDINLGHRRGN